MIYIPLLLLISPFLFDVYHLLIKINSSQKYQKSLNIIKWIEIITCIKLNDIIFFRDNIILNLRKKLVDLQCNQVLSELQSEGFLSNKKTNKKHKKKKINCNEVENIKIEDKKEEEKKEQNVEINMKIDKKGKFEKLKECECE